MPLNKETKPNQTIIIKVQENLGKKRNLIVKWDVYAWQK